MLFLAGLLCPMLLFAQGGDWALSLEMDQAPPLGGWQGPQTSHEVQDGVLRIIDRSSEDGSGHAFEIPWEARPEEETIVEARVKVIFSQGDAGVCLWLSNGVHEEGVVLHEEGVALYHAKLRYAMNTTDDFHVYRVTIKGEDLKVYVDGRLALDASGKFITPAYRRRNQLSFGSCSSRAQGESLWDYVRFKAPWQGQRGAPPPEREHIVIFREPNTYAVFPSVHYEEATGRLYVSFRAGGPRSHIDAQGARRVTMISDDGGKTWREGAAPPKKPMFVGPNGLQINVWCKWWQEHPAAERANLEAQGYYVENVRPGTVAICAGAICACSRDNGQTWEQKEIAYPFMALLASGMNARQLAEGTILFPVYGKQKATDRDATWVLRSTDYGESWQLIPVAIHPERDMQEPAIVETKSGRLLIVMRTGGADDHLWQAVSDDKGASWHSLRDTGVKGHPPDLIRLHDGRLLLSYGYRHLPGGPGIRAVVSTDEGTTWELDHLWILRNDGGSYDLGYPHSVQLKDGTVVTVYYFCEPGGMQYIACTRWRVPE